MSNDSRYVEAALDRACQAIGSALEGARNTTLNEQSYAIGRLVGSGSIDYHQAYSRLLTAAREARMDRREADSTIRSGLDAGQEDPRSPSKPLVVVPAIAQKHSDYAAKIYAEAEPIEGTLAETYLTEIRGLTGPFPKNLRFHPSLHHSGACKLFPAMVAPIVQPDTAGRPHSIHITYLDPDTARKAGVDPNKRILGQTEGGGIWMGKYTAQLLVSEGIEKALAVQAATGICAVAGVSSTMLPNLVIPTGVQQIIITADGDLAGEKAVRKATIKWGKQGIKVFTSYPPVSGKDWDECTRDEIRAAIRSSKEVIAKDINELVSASIARAELGDFHRSENGSIIKSEYNILLALAYSGVEFSFNAFSQQYVVDGLEGHGPHLTDAAIDELYLMLAREWRLKPSYEDFRRIIRSQCRRNSFHPVREYLDHVQSRWDGLPRINKWLNAYGGAPESEFIETIGAITLIAACRRVREPGCKFDEMLIMEGKQGISKSLAIRALAGDEWFSDSAPFDVAPREVIEQLRGFWIVEAAELETLRRASAEHLKAFLSRSEDIATLKFERETTRLLRQCIFIGTTNKKNYLVSDTGNRRFWPVEVEGFDVDALKRDRDQLWAEASHREAAGEQIRLPKRFWEQATEQQEMREEPDEWDGIVGDYLRAEMGDRRNAYEPVRVTIAQVAWKALQIGPDKLDAKVNHRIARSLKRCGWYSKPSGGKNWWFKKPDPYSF